jgi:Holliday junction resolvasome RuvABC ATP-dependent DNA helicase subunit
MSQLEKVFFPINSDPPFADDRRAYLDSTNPVSPYFGFVGNKRAVDKLIRIDFEALGRYNHCCSDLSVAFLGQAGCGKTELARRHAKANKLPYVEISPKAIKTCHDLLMEIARVCAASGLPLIEVGRAQNYWIPPCNVFIDEVHALAPPVVQGLLKATEYNDAILVTDKGYTADCKRVHWLIATTDRGKLFDAFDTRFSKVILNLYTKDEVAKIVQFNNPDWTFDICQLVAHYCGRIPREALAFAREMKLEHNMHSDLTWRQVGQRIASDNEIDEFGMSYKRLAILKALGHGPIAEKRLPLVIGVKVEELDKFILPWLVADTDDQPALVGVCNKGYCLTDAGIAELKLRKLPYKEAA